MFKVYNSFTGEREKGCWAIRQGQLMKYSRSIGAFVPVNNRDYIVKRGKKHG